MSVQGSGFIHFLAVMAALGYLMDSFFNEALVSMVMAECHRSCSKGAGLFYGPFIPCPQGPTLSVNLSGKHFRSSLLRIAVYGRAPTQHQRTVQTCCAHFRIKAGIAFHSPNGSVLPAFTREQQLAPQQGNQPSSWAAWCPLH